MTVAPFLRKKEDKGGGTRSPYPGEEEGVVLSLQKERSRTCLFFSGFFYEGGGESLSPRKAAVPEGGGTSLSAGEGEKKGETLQEELCPATRGIPSKGGKKKLSETTPPKKINR